MIFKKPKAPELPYELLTHSRPCLVDGDQAYFHCWVGQDAIIDGEGGKAQVARRTYALIEYIDGTVEHVFPEKVRFTNR